MSEHTGLVTNLCLGVVPKEYTLGYASAEDPTIPGVRFHWVAYDRDLRKVTSNMIWLVQEGSWVFEDCFKGAAHKTKALQATFQPFKDKFEHYQNADLWNESQGGHMYSESVKSDLATVVPHSGTKSKGRTQAVAAGLQSIQDLLTLTAHFEGAADEADHRLVTIADRTVTVGEFSQADNRTNEDRFSAERTDSDQEAGGPAPAESKASSMEHVITVTSNMDKVSPCALNLIRSQFNVVAPFQRSLLQAPI